MADFGQSWPNARSLGRKMASFGQKIMKKSAKMTLRPRHSGVFLTLFSRSMDARFRTPFSVVSKSPLIQGSRKVENTIGIFIHPIQAGPENWCYGWDFDTEFPDPGEKVSPPGQKVSFLVIFRDFLAKPVENWPVSG